jgi:hypothetical protein
MIARATREDSGHDGRTVFPVMPYTQYRSMSDEDVASIVVYLRTLPAVQRAPPDEGTVSSEPAHPQASAAQHVDNTLPATRCPMCGGMHGRGDENVVGGTER